MKLKRGLAVFFFVFFWLFQTPDCQYLFGWFSTGNKSTWVGLGSHGLG